MLGPVAVVYSVISPTGMSGPLLLFFGYFQCFADTFVEKIFCEIVDDPWRLNHTFRMVIILAEGVPLWHSGNHYARVNVLHHESACDASWGHQSVRGQGFFAF